MNNLKYAKSLDKILRYMIILQTLHDGDQQISGLKQATVFPPTTFNNDIRELRDMGYIISKKINGSNKVKVYRLTDTGQKVLLNYKQQWLFYQNELQAMLDNMKDKKICSFESGNNFNNSNNLFLQSDQTNEIIVLSYLCEHSAFRSEITAYTRHFNCVVSPFDSNATFRSLKIKKHVTCSDEIDKQGRYWIITPQGRNYLNEILKEWNTKKEKINKIVGIENA